MTIKKLLINSPEPYIMNYDLTIDKAATSR